MSEIEAIEQLHRAAQARIGLAVSLLSKSSWASVQATNPATTGAQWATQVARAIIAARESSATLARAYYQLARAVETGFTMGAPLADRPATLGGLRDSFLEQVLAVAEIGESSEHSPFHEIYSGDTAGGALRQIDILPEVQNFLDFTDDSTDGRTVRVEPFNWPTLKSGDETIERIQRQLRNEAVTPLENDVSKLRRRAEDSSIVNKIEQRHTATGQLGAGRADELTMRAGRSVLEHAQNSDRRVLKYARGTAANPCHFCAMLASRGFVYASSKSASKTYREGGFRSYHPNCHCFPIARWVEESALPQSNAYYQQLWNSEIRNKFSGRAALRQWRRVIAAERRKGTDTTDE